MKKFLLFLFLFFAFARCAFADLYLASRGVIRVTVRSGGQVGVGSGVIVGSDAKYYYALTNAHVATSRTCEVEFFDAGNPTRRSAETVMRDEAVDLAVLRIDAEGYNPHIVPIDPSYTMKKGDILATIGHPKGEMPTGYYCTYQGTSETMGICFTPPPKQGRSGSPLLTLDGSRVVGIVYGYLTSEPYHGLAVPATVVSDFVKAGMGEKKRESRWVIPKRKDVVKLSVSAGIPNGKRSILVPSSSSDEPADGYGPADGERTEKDGHLEEIPDLPSSDPLDLEEFPAVHPSARFQLFRGNRLIFSRPFPVLSDPGSLEPLDGDKPPPTRNAPRRLRLRDHLRPPHSDPSEPPNLSGFDISELSRSGMVKLTQYQYPFQYTPSCPDGQCPTVPRPLTVPPSANVPEIGRVPAQPISAEIIPELDPNAAKLLPDLPPEEVQEPKPSAKSPSVPEERPIRSLSPIHRGKRQKDETASAAEGLEERISALEKSVGELSALIRSQAGSTAFAPREKLSDGLESGVKDGLKEGISAGARTVSESLSAQLSPLSEDWKTTTLELRTGIQTARETLTLAGSELSELSKLSAVSDSAKKIASDFRLFGWIFAVLLICFRLLAFSR